MKREYALYLHVGDRVYHKYFRRWGVGTVVEERSSDLPGGFCYVRIDFQDGKRRVFDNNFRSECCCYYAGIVRIEVEEDLEEPARRQRSGGRSSPRRKALSGSKG